MPADPMFTATAETNGRGEPRVHLWHGMREHVLTVDEARALRASLDAAITAADPPGPRCHIDGCPMTATHGPCGYAAACWSHAGNWPEASPEPRPSPTSSPPALAHGYRVLALLGRRWTLIEKDAALPEAEATARHLDEQVFADRATPPTGRATFTGWAILDSHLRTVSSDTPADCHPPPALATLLRNVTPCDGGGTRPCGGTERVVVGFDVQAAGLVDVACLRCDARSGMRPEVAAECGRAAMEEHHRAPDAPKEGA